MHVICMYIYIYTHVFHRAGMHVICMYIYMYFIELECM